MKLINKTLLLFCCGIMLGSCYKDQGNYDYNEINEIEIDGIADYYSRDIYEKLTITPDLTGSLYSDTTRFDFSWQINDKEVCKWLKLDLLIDMEPGEKKGTLIVTEKDTKIKSYTFFTVNVSSATAGDLYMILSKSNGKAELSYLRLDRENSEFVINFYEKFNGTTLGVNPQQLCMIDFKARNSEAYPFSDGQGRIAALIDNKAYLMDKHTLKIDPETNTLTGDTYTLYIPGQKPDLSRYKSEFLLSTIEMSRITNSGALQESATFVEVSGGAIYWLNYVGNSPTMSSRTPNLRRGTGYFSPFIFFDVVTDSEASDRYLYTQGNDLGKVIAFDEASDQFCYATSISTNTIAGLPVYADYKMIYGSDTEESSRCFAILHNGSSSKLILINMAATPAYAIGGEASTTLIDRNTKFYTMKYSSDLLFTSGNKLYRYNLLNIVNGIAPSENNCIATLTDLGYDADAKITSLCVSRSERTILLGVSRYGDDTEGMGSENKGDLVELNFSASTFAVSHRHTYTGISGIPVDVKVKYQSYLRNGKNQYGVYQDKI